MPTRNVVITEHQDDLIDHLVQSGRYQNASEVLRDGLRMVEARESDNADKLRALREAIDVGIAEADAGNVTAFDDTKPLRAHLTALGRRARSR